MRELWNPRVWLPKAGAATAAAAAAALLALQISPAALASTGALVPAPQADMPRAAGLQTAVLAGGCFWGLEAVFERVKGVRGVVSGYAGGSRADATYKKVTSERTRHAEAVQIRYDPAQVSYGTLLRIYFSVTTDPTQLNRQGPDVGPSYRSAIFPQNAAQARVARAYIAQLGKAGVYKRPIVTRIESGAFYPAEAYHQDFMRKNPRHPYILAHDVPKVAALKRLFPALYRG
jgi:peptide-methionine (S)-S-oxide reductase